MYSSYGYNSSDVAAVGGFLIFLIIAIVVYCIIVGWRIISKSGDKGWKILIPIYGAYVFYKALDSANLFWATVVVGFAGGLISSLLASGSDGTASVIISVLLIIANIVIYAKLCNNGAKAFGKSGGFAVGLFFLPLIFQSILAFGSAQHWNQAPASIEEKHY